MKILIIFLLFIFGLIFGSFFCCMGYRIPNKMKTVFDKSACPHCNNKLKWYMNIPVFSFIFLKGKCAYCKNKISYIYPLIEVCTGALFALSYILFDFNYEFYLSVIISSMLMVTVVSDFKYYYISDRVLLLGFISAVIINYSYYGFKYTFQNIICALIIFGFMMLIKLLGNIAFKKESLGDGDIKLMAVLASIFGLKFSFVVLFIGSLLGLIFSFMFKKKDGIIPFGPFLLIASLIVLYFISYIDNFIRMLIF